MKVVILCGGLGTRMREETEFRPKPMVRVGQRPILWHIMKIYAHHGFKDFVLCLGYKGEVIKEYFFNYEIYNHDFVVNLGRSKSIEVFDSRDELDWRVSLVDTGDAKPTDQDYAVLRELTSRLDEIRARMEAVLQGDLPELNRRLVELGIQGVSVKQGSTEWRD